MTEEFRVAIWANINGQQYGGLLPIEVSLDKITWQFMKDLEDQGLVPDDGIHLRIGPVEKREVIKGDVVTNDSQVHERMLDVQTTDEERQ